MDALSTNDTDAIIETDRARIWHHLSQHKPYETIDPRIMVEGKGMRVWDARGKEFLDAVSGAVWTVNVGYGRERIANAMRDQILKLHYFAGSAGTIPGAIFSQMLIDKMPGLSRIYYANSGSEANEKVFKMVRQISHKKYGGKKYKILYRERDYHGMTIGTLSAGGQDERGAQYGPFVPGFIRIPHFLEYRNQFDTTKDYGPQVVAATEEIILREGPETIGAMCLEPITAGGGVITPPDGYWEGMSALCRKYNILMHIDEVVCGVGRTGTWFGYQHYDIQPDFVTMAKGLASGYAAISAVATTEAVFDMFKESPEDKMSYFRDISTFGGCTSGYAAAIENMKIIEEEGLLENCTAMGEYCLGKLRDLKDKHAVVGDVRGKGLFLGVELVNDRVTKEPADEKMVAAVCANCMDQGVIIGMTNRSIPGMNNTLCLSPPLIVTKQDIDEIVGAIDIALGDVFS